MARSIEALHPGPTSAEVIRDIFAMHFPTVWDEGFPEPIRVLDLTYGRGVFWKWDWIEQCIYLTTNDLYVEEANYHDDFMAPSFRGDVFDVVVFDPPHTASGYKSQAGYGSFRSQKGGVKNILDVQQRLEGGLREAMRLAQVGVIVKTMDVIESEKYWDSEYVALSVLHETWGRNAVADKVRFLTSRRAQPDEARGCEIEHFRNRPSLFIIAKRGNK